MASTSSTSPIVDSARATCVAWFTGSACTRAMAALDLLAAAERNGSLSSVSRRKIFIAFGKADVAIKLGKKYHQNLMSINDYSGAPFEHQGRSVSETLVLSKWRGERKIFWAYIMEKAPSDEVRTVVDAGRRFVRDFAPLAELCQRLSNE